MSERKTLPNRRACETFQFDHDKIEYTATVGYFDLGMTEPGEIFLAAGKAGTPVENNARDAAVLASLALQHGVPIDTMRHAMTRNQDGSASGPLGAMLDDLASNRRSPEAAEAEPIPPNNSAPSSLDGAAMKGPS